MNLGQLPAAPSTRPVESRPRLRLLPSTVAAPYTRPVLPRPRHLFLLIVLLLLPDVTAGAGVTSSYRDLLMVLPLGTPVSSWCYLSLLLLLLLLPLDTATFLRCYFSLIVAATSCSYCRYWCLLLLPGPPPAAATSGTPL